MAKTLVVAKSRAKQAPSPAQTEHPAADLAGRPDPEWVRGVCPECGDDLVSNLYYVGGKGYLIRWECWSSLKETPTCSYRKVL